MTEDFSEKRHNISCDECGHVISDEFIKKNQNKPLYCELCGAQINLKSSEKEEISKRERKEEIITPPEENEVRFSYTTEELRQEIKNYVYKKIYELLKTTPFVIRRLKQQKDLKYSQKIKLAKKSRRILMHTSLPTQGLERLTIISQKKIENYFDTFKSSLKAKQRFQSKIHPGIIKNIEFVFRLINGDFELSTLSRVNQKAVKNLLDKQGFKINTKRKNSFSYQISLFLCRQIYKKITAQDHALLYSKNQLTKHYILNTAKDMITLLLNDLVKRRFSQNYRTLKQNLELDWIYRESLINHICSLVKFVYKLTYNTGHKFKLNAFKRLIAEDLKRSKFFENDEYITPEFKLNLTLILCRIIYKMMESNSNLNSQEQGSKNLNILNKNKISNIILEEILAENEIKSEFLKKFYKLSLEKFQKEYDKFQVKIKLDIIYKENFRIYIYQLRKTVYKIIHSSSKKSKHTKIELVIIKDLSNYNIKWDNNQIDPRECFIRKEKESFNLGTNNQNNNVNTIKKQKFSNIIENKTGINEKEINDLKNLEKKVIILIKEIIERINFSNEHKKIILLKSLKVLNTFISRAEDKEFIIRRDTELATIASSIIYAVIVSNKNMPKINLTAISNLTKVNVGTINSFYNNHFRYLYPKVEFSLNFSKKLRKIKDIFALYFFEMLKDLDNKSIKEIESTILNYLSTLKKNILSEINLPKQLSKRDVKLLHEIIDIYPDIFNKYFSDLAKIVNYIIIQCNILNKIGAKFIVQPFCDFIIKNNINLLYKPSTLGRYIIPEIYDYLKEFYPNLFPIRVFQRKVISKNELKRMKNEYRLNIGNKIKIYIIKHIYNGLYFKHGKGQCPKCLEEKFLINTDISRLSSLEFHHKSKKKERSFTAPELGRIFENSGFNPNFLEDLIKLIESEKVKLLCRNHHKIIHNKYYRYFRYLINYEDIFSLPPELIHIIAKVSVENFSKTRDLVGDSSYYARYTIIRYLKKRYIIESFYGELCPCCKEFNIKKFLPSFDYHHNEGSRFHHNPHVKTQIKSASTLFIQSYSCSEIAKILNYEKGGFLCANCHNVMGYSSSHLNSLHDLYDDFDLVKKTIEDYNNVKNRFKIFFKIPKIGDPLNITKQLTNNYVKYIKAMYKLSQQGNNITHSSLAHTLHCHTSTISEFLNRNISFFKNFVDIQIGKNRLKNYILKDEGKMYIKIMHHFMEYYKNL